jgi:4-amino-4-deoxychorismate lyase
MKAPRILIDGVATARIDARDRGLAYGDGVFETCRFIDGRAPLWTRHMARLFDACARLGLSAPDAEQLQREARRVCTELTCAVVRITITRGIGERGYALPRESRPRRIVCAFPAPAATEDWYRRGIRVRWCATRLAEQPRLAGIKHLNRLEQVLARAEWDAADIAEGLMLDASGNVIGATAANVFAVIGRRLVTPALDRCGVVGVMRAQVLAWRENAQVRSIGVDELMQANEIFLTNAVRGIVPVTALDDWRRPVGPVATSLLRQWMELFSEEAA